MGKSPMLLKLLILSTLLLCCFVGMGRANTEEWKLTAYCSCKKCCGKTDGITASGKPATRGFVACNWLPFGTIVDISGYGKYKVMDRGAKSQFGSKTNHIKHLDIWMPTHREALNFGVRYAQVEVAK